MKPTPPTASGDDAPDATTGAAQALVETDPPRDPRLTLPATRLAGSGSCLNCGTTLAGPYCHYCGQPDRNFMRFFPVLLRDLLADALDFDSRFLRTMLPLLFRPGKLTREYLDGRRSRYTPPMRLYLFSSIAFFLAAALASFVMTDIEVRVATDPPVSSSAAPGAEEALPARSEDDDFDIGTIQFNDSPWDAETNPVVLPFIPQSLNNWVNREIGESPSKAKMISTDPQIIVREMLDLLPATIFIMLPFVALILKFWYLFSGRFYIEHLVLALHNHAFIFVCLLMLVALEGLESWFESHGLTAGTTVASALIPTIGVWIPVYWSLPCAPCTASHGR